MQTTERPRFRQDLVAEAIEDQGARFIDVMDPDSGNLFRFYEVEYSLACAMDGERDVTSIVQWAREELGVSPSAAEVRTVIATLGSLGFIEGGAAAHQTELVPGVVVGARTRQPAQDIELGNAGTTRDRFNDMPAAPNIALGAPGASAPRPHAPVENIPLGASGAGRAAPERRTPEPGKQMLPSVAAPSMKDVSVDLSEQMAVRRDDVKEAVRASKVMQAADVPRDLLVPSDDDKTIKAPAPVMDAHLPRPVVESAKPAVQLRQPTPVPRLVTPVPEPPLARKPSPVLLVVLILVLLGGAAFLIWKYVLDTTDGSGATSSQPASSATPVAAKPAPEPKKPTPAPKAKLTTDQPSPQEIKTGNAGVVEAVETNDKVVKSGDTILWLAGHKAIENEITGLTLDVEKRLPQEIAMDQRDRDAADKAGNKGDLAAMDRRIAERKKALEARQAQLDGKKADLQKLVVKTSLAGRFAIVAKPGAKVNADDVVAKIAREPVLAATFAVPNGWVGAKLAVDVPVKLRDDAHPEKAYDCTIAEVTEGGAKIKVTCPIDPTLDGAAVTLVGK